MLCSSVVHRQPRSTPTNRSSQSAKPLASTSPSQGWTVAIPDHLGPSSPYGAAKLGGQFTFDDIRAARRFDALGLGASPVGMAGYSGGAMATAMAATITPTHPPTHARRTRARRQRLRRRYRRCRHGAARQRGHCGRVRRQQRRRRFFGAQCPCVRVAFRNRCPDPGRGDRLDNRAVLPKPECQSPPTKVCAPNHLSAAVIIPTRRSRSSSTTASPASLRPRTAAIPT
ncbi:lipase family protein [Rhodococcus sp. IEGM 1318]|uniref:lipase family protein n=1 Tax=Rhodococcus sp. IEGM 1318 TaxID=3082226 RepID=UPI002954815A|nr:lipase family protein [Rhodococcus sp. IEGM 1318]MDV8009448.1 lipase family protein [Rhodococcus sp. IEGM 1318]